MSSLNFPSSPTNGQTYTTPNGVTYQYNGTFWNAINTTYAVGGFSKLDDISSQFNGGNTQFQLTKSGIPVLPALAQNLIIVLGGVPQEPGTAFTISTSYITFSEAPTIGTSFYGVALGDVGNVGAPSDQTVSFTKLDSNLYDYISTTSANTVYLQGALNQTNTNIVTANTQLKSYVDGSIVSANTQLKSYVDGKVVNIPNSSLSNSFISINDTTVSLGQSITIETGLILQTVKTSNFNALSGNSYPVNTTSGEITATLPSSPTVGDQINFIDYAGTTDTNSIVINPNGNKINGSVNNILIKYNRSSVTLIYVDTTQGWAVVNAGDNSQLAINVQYLIVAGGGGGGYDAGGGGGAGGLINSTTTLGVGTTHSIVVGGGGAGDPGSGAGNGGNSSVFGQTSIGGGRGGGGIDASGSPTGASGGSGGGGCGDVAGNVTYYGGSGTSGQGYGGGSGFHSPSSNAGGGGGGGAGGVGENEPGSPPTGNPQRAGNGGIGTNSYSSWASATGTGSGGYYAGGGGGGINSDAGNTGAGGTGGAGGGGAGSRDGAGTAGTANTGGGGGGGKRIGGVGAAGGSGIVILRYSGGIKALGGSITSSGGYTYHVFTSSGTFTLI